MAHGGFAEYSIVPAAARCSTMPDDIPFPDAAAVMFPFHLAWLGLFDRAELRAGETVLVHAAAGGSGSAAVQLAVDAGARVIATVGSEAKNQLCRDLGADVVVDYTRRGLRGHWSWRRPANGASDVVFDNVGVAVMPAR